MQSQVFTKNPYSSLSLSSQAEWKLNQNEVFFVENLCCCPAVLGCRTGRGEREEEAQQQVRGRL